MKNEILIQKRQRYWYDRCLEMAGGKLVEFGTDEETTQDDLANAIGPNTAVVHYVSYEQHPVDPHALTLDQTIEVAKDNGVPVMVDAAGQIYPLENLSKYVKAGADISCVAAKYMGAPHSTGFALGTEDAIRKLGLQSFVSYEGRRIRGIGRPHKVDRGEMMGVVAAVRRWMTMNHETRLAHAEQQSQTMLKPLQGIPGVRVELVNNVIANQPFGVKIDIDPDVAGTTVEDVVDRLKEHDPPIWTRPNPYGTGMVLHVFGLYEGEDKIVGEAMADVLKQGVPA
jgi:seryl-tRNA(Sec) selenium transferase